MSITCNQAKLISKMNLCSNALRHIGAKVYVKIKNKYIKI